MPKGQRRQNLSLREGEPARSHRREHAVVSEWVDDHRDAGMVLRRRPHHRRAADVDLLDALVLARAGLDGRAERVQVHDHQLEGRHAEFLERGEVLGLAGVGQQARVHAGVQRLDAPVEHLGESR